MKQERAHVGFLIGPGSNSKEIGDVGVGGTRSPVEGFSNRTQANIRRNNTNSAGDRGSVHAITRKRPDSRRTPQRCGGIQSRDVQPVSQDYACSQKADARDHLPRDAEAIVRTRCKSREHYKHSGSCRHQGICAKAGHALPPLAFRTDQCAQKQCEAESNCKLVPEHFSSTLYLSLDFQCLNPQRGFKTPARSQVGSRRLHSFGCWVEIFAGMAEIPTRSSFGHSTRASRSEVRSLILCLLVVDFRICSTRRFRF